jgi:hypothetical protein
LKNLDVLRPEPAPVGIKRFPSPEAILTVTLAGLDKKTLVKCMKLIQSKILRRVRNNRSSAPNSRFGIGGATIHQSNEKKKKKRYQY